MSTPREPAEELHELLAKLVAFPVPERSGRAGFAILGRIDQIVFDEALDANDRAKRLGILLGECLAAGKLLSLPPQRLQGRRDGANVYLGPKGPRPMKGKR